MKLKLLVVFFWMLKISNCKELKEKNPLHNATHYWNMNKYNKWEAKDSITQLHLKFKNRGVSVEKQKQLGNVLQLDGRISWLEIPHLQDKCLTSVSCTRGMTFSFWMKYKSGDYIMSAGKIAVSEEFMSGFRLQRDPLTNFFILEIISEESQRIWKIYLKELPKSWFHFLFTWQSNEGARLYIDGDLKLTRRLSEPAPNNNVELSNSLGERDAHKVTFGQIGSLREMDDRGEFEISHIAIWKKVLTDEDIIKVYKNTVATDDDVTFCCNGKKNALGGACAKWDSYSCICTELKKEDICRKPILTPAKFTETKKECVDLNPHCDKLVNNQVRGYCESFVDSAMTDCKYSCRCKPVTQMMMSRQPKQHFTQEALIFALLGCIGGLILLFGIMFYFWKVYRTQCYPSETKGERFLS
eukprot:TCONS_00070999-protein